MFHRSFISRERKLFTTSKCKCPRCRSNSYLSAHYECLRTVNGRDQFGSDWVSYLLTTYLLILTYLLTYLLTYISPLENREYNIYIYIYIYLLKFNSCTQHGFFFPDVELSLFEIDPTMFQAMNRSVTATMHEITCRGKQSLAVLITTTIRHPMTSVLAMHLWSWPCNTMQAT